MAAHGHPWPPMAAHGHPWPPMAAFSKNYFIRGRMAAFFSFKKRPFIKKRLWPDGRPFIRYFKKLLHTWPDGQVHLKVRK